MPTLSHPEKNKTLPSPQREGSEARLCSILIPTHNFAPTALVADLHKQAAALTNMNVEILVLDDASDNQTAQNALREMEAAGYCRVLRQERNQGRARARNILYGASRGEILLFIDSDAEVTDTDFLARHLADAKQADVVCGGLTNPPLPAAKGCELRHKYEIEAERKGFRSTLWLNDHPHERISTFNLLVHRRVMEVVPFNEELTEYGYEDVAWGLSLQQHGFKVLHTANSLLHTGINSNAAFLANTEAAMRNLALLPADIQHHIPIARLAKRLQERHLAFFVRLAFRLTKPILHHNLLSSHPILTFFQFYKIGFFLTTSA